MKNILKVTILFCLIISYSIIPAFAFDRTEPVSTDDLLLYNGVYVAPYAPYGLGLIQESNRYWSYACYSSVDTPIYLAVVNNALLRVSDVYNPKFRTAWKNVPLSDDFSTSVPNSAN